MPKTSAPTMGTAIPDSGLTSAVSNTSVADTPAVDNSITKIISEFSEGRCGTLGDLCDKCCNLQNCAFLNDFEHTEESCLQMALVAEHPEAEKLLGASLPVVPTFHFVRGYSLGDFTWYYLSPTDITDDESLDSACAKTLERMIESYSIFGKTSFFHTLHLDILQLAEEIRRVMQ